MKIFFILLSWVAFSSSALAFHEIESFSRVEKGGGNGSFFTGSSRFKGYDCGICHTKTDDTISISLEVNRPEFGQGLYEANTGYAITVRLIGEHRGLDSAFNPNTFMLEIVNDQGESVGDFLPGSASVELIDERRIIAAEGFGEGENEWSFTWFSPRDPVGPLTMHIGMVDGDGAGEPVLRFIDPINDDVATLKVRLCPLGEACPKAAGDPKIESAVHCGVAGSIAVPGSALLWLLMAMLFLPSKRGRSAGLLCLLLGLVGCGASTPPTASQSADSTQAEGFRLRYALPASSGLVGDEATTALDQSLIVLRKRAKDLQIATAVVSRSGSEITVDIPGGNELSVAELRSALPLRGLFGLHVVRHEGTFMKDLCESLAHDSKAGVMRIETGLDLWQGREGSTVRQCYLAANDRVAMLNAQEAAAEKCPSRGDAERTRCVVSGRTMLKRYLAERGDIELEIGYILAFASDQSSETGGEIGERYWRSYYLQIAASVDSSMIESISVEESPELAGSILQVGLNSQGAQALRELTERHVGHKLAIVIDGSVESAPTIIATIADGKLSFPLAPNSLPAEIIAASLRSGPLPAALEEVAATSY